MKNKDQHSLLSPVAMGRVDAAAALSGLDSFGLMIRAGEAVAASALRHFPEATRHVILCGPGNNGGDGYVAAEALRRSGCTVRLYHLGSRDELKGDARRASEQCYLKSVSLEDYEPQQGDVIIDALFGAGLSKDVPSLMVDLFANIADAQLPVIAVDLPSGLCGRRGTVLGAALKADFTVTFMRRKPGHLLLPGRDLCGQIEVFDIGIPHRILNFEAAMISENHPDIWSAFLPGIQTSSHKFSRGHLGVFSGPLISTGAARMSAMAGLRAGAGLVTVAASDNTIPALASHLTAVMMREVNDEDDLSNWIADPRLTAFILGPGFGIGEKARTFVKILSTRRLVLDADGISSFAANPDDLFNLFAQGETRLIMTPHEGEFGRLFPDIFRDSNLSKVEKAVLAAQRSNAIMVYKGADTIIASPNGLALINTNAPPALATAGSGDVLAGIIGGLLAQSMPAFEAAAAGVWFHGRAGKKAGPSLTAEDLALALDTHL